MYISLECCIQCAQKRRTVWSSLKISCEVSVCQKQAQLFMVVKRAGSFLIKKKKGTKKMNRYNCNGFLFWRFWRYDRQAVLGDQQASLPSSLLPWGQCVSCCSVPPGLHVLYVSVFGHTQPVTGGQVRLWFLEEWTAAKPHTNATTRDS